MGLVCDGERVIKPGYKVECNILGATLPADCEHIAVSWQTWVDLTLDSHCRGQSCQFTVWTVSDVSMWQEGVWVQPETSHGAWLVPTSLTPGKGLDLHLPHGHGLLSANHCPKNPQEEGKTWEHDWEEESQENVRNNTACTRLFPHAGQFYTALNAWHG